MNGEKKKPDAWERIQDEAVSAGLACAKVYLLAASAAPEPVAALFDARGGCRLFWVPFNDEIYLDSGQLAALYLLLKEHVE